MDEKKVVYISKELFDKLKEEKLRNGKTMKYMVEKAIEQYLKKKT